MNDAEAHLMTVFSTALDCGSAEERAAYLDRACAGDPALRERVEALLRAHGRGGDFLGRAAGPAKTTGFEPGAGEASPDTAPDSGAVIAGRYKLLERIGEGGMGEVWMAEQTEPVRRKVALKLVKPGMDSRQVLARFEAERQALALMDHPNIARVLDGGSTEAGRPFFVMELVKGVPVTKYCDDHRLTPRERLELFAQVCQAVQHAHQKGIIHRDIKPSNVLVAPYDGVPVPKVIDFGIAKAAGQPLTEKTLFTGLGVVVGTPEYMSPEQAELNNQDIDTRSDVYALGVLLYELLTGSTPLTRKRLKEAALLEVLRLVREEEPPRPSTRLSTTDELPTVAANRGLEPRKLSGVVRGELDWIVMRALEKDRNRRYESANGLGEDVRRYLADEPVQACPPSAWYRLSKFGRRHRAALVTAGVVAAALLLATAVSVWQAVRANDALKSERETRSTLDAERAETDRQRSRVNGDLSDALVETAGLREKARAGRFASKNWAAVREAAKRAQTLAAHELADPLLARRVESLLAELKQDEIDQNTEAQLEEIRLNPDLGSNREPALAVFRAYGIPVGGMSVDLAAKRVAASSIRDSLVLTLDYLADSARNENERWMLSVARGVSDDPWRKTYFDARLRGDWVVMRELAARPDTLKQPPGFIGNLGRALHQYSSSYDLGAGADLCRRALALYPAELSILRVCSESNVPFSAGEIFPRMVLAMRPESPSANMALGYWLQRLGRDEEAVALFDRAFPAQAQNPWIQEYTRIHRDFARGRLLEREGKLDQAIEAFQEATRRSRLPTTDVDMPAFEHLLDLLERKGAPAEVVNRWLAEYAKAFPQTGAEMDKRREILLKRGMAREAIAVDMRFLPGATANDPAAGKRLIELIARSGLLEETLAGLHEGDANRAIILEQTGRLEEALAAWEKCLSNPKSGKGGALSWMLYGDALRRAKRLPQAEAAYRSALKVDPYNPVVRGRLDRLAAKDAPDEDVRFRGSSAAGGALMLQGNDLRAKGDLKGAVAAYKRAIELYPDGLFWYYNLGEALLALNGEQGGDEAACRKVLELYPHAAAAHCALAGVLSDRGAAIAACRRAIELDNKFASAYAELAAALVRPPAAKADLEAAVDAYSTAIKLEPTKDGYLCCRGDLYRQLGERDKGLADCDAALALSPDYHFALSLKGELHADAGQWEKAVEAFSRSINARSTDSAFLGRARAYQKLKKWDSAVADYGEFLRLFPQTESRGSVLNEFAWLLATCSDPLVRNPRRAVAHAQELVKGSPRVSAFWNTLGVAQYRAGDWKAAVEALDKSRELSGGGIAEDWCFLAMAHRKLGHDDEARKAYDRAVQWLEKNKPLLEKNPDRAKELERFRGEAEEVLELKK
jgi:serine/threonine protein kinase/tetratricopeptide (TPR) repeat protein